VAASQTIIVTVVPRGVAVDAETLPISLFLTPRLRGADRLGAFRDWQLWTQLVRDEGLTLTISCAGRALAFTSDPAPLAPELWAGLFNADTSVRSHEFDDYSERAVLSYPVRETLSALKRIYQEAGVRLALPDAPLGRDDERGNRRILRQLIAGLEVHWNPNSGEAWRTAMRRAQTAGRSSAPRHATAALDDEGLIVAPVSEGANREVALPFAVFHHMPTPKRDELAPDWDTMLDFHQALASVNAYPAVQRALGVVFEVELPADFVPVNSTGDPIAISASLDAGWDWALTPQVPQLETACLHLQLDDGRVVFLAAPRSVVDRSAPTQVIGLLDLDPQRFGVAQVDVDGAMHKAIILAETWHDPDPGRSLSPDAQPEPAQHPEVFDPEATLPALRSGGFSLFADGRAQHLLDAIRQSKAFNDAVETSAQQSRPLCADDLVRGYRLDVWDSWTTGWHSLHARRADYRAGEGRVEAELEEGFVQLAAMQAAEGAQPKHDDLYLHEAIARWAGWSLAVEMPGKHLSRYADPDLAVPPDGDDPEFRTNEAKTPFELATKFDIVSGSLPRLRFGRRYRFRARVADLAGTGLELHEPITDELGAVLSLPRDADGFPYLRYEPVAAPLVVIRDEAAVTGPGSAVDRIVIRSYNDNDDTVPAKTNAADRHILPPRTSVELGERLGMFDDADGELRSDAATWKLIADRDAGELHHSVFDVAGASASYPIEPGESVDALPYLPDVLAAGAALRDLPGTPGGSLGRAGSTGAIGYDLLSDPNPRPGSATLVPYDSVDWTEIRGFRLGLVETAGDDVAPSWDATAKSLSVRLPKGTMTTVALSSYLDKDALNLMGQWRWLREFVDHRVEEAAAQQHLRPGTDVDRIAHVLQRAVEGGHWLLTPPKLITLVHAVQQPLGRPEFIPLDVEHEPTKAPADELHLETEPITGRSDPTELAPITAWRRLGATDAYLMGALRVHGSSTAKVDLVASWDDYSDETGDEYTVTSNHGQVEELSLRTLDEDYLEASARPRRFVGYYDPQHDQIAFTRAGDWAGRPDRDEIVFDNAAPRQVFNDAKHRRVTYTSIATSRFREYFSDDHDFTRSSDPVVVDVPASARPVAPSVVYVLPTFGWQRQTDTNIMRSVRFGGGLRVYLDRPWFSSGEGELLGVALWSSENGTFDDDARDKFKPYITQWGMDPIWQSDELSGVPGAWNFPDAGAVDYAVSLEEANAGRHGRPGRVDVVGFAPQYDKERRLWFADLTLDTFTATYGTFVRLALVRYQPNALLDAKISRVVLADFAQLTPDRSAVVTSDPYRPRTVNVVVSGVAPRAPSRNRVSVRVQNRDPAVETDLGWRDVPAAEAAVATRIDATASSQPDLALWAGTVSFATAPDPGRFRLLIEEREYIGQGRLIYAEAFELDHTLVS
jgi:hypothetical protein